MKVVILAGGFGTRLSEYTENIPKPMVKIGNKPILWHIMNRYAKFGHNEFFLALGYKSEVVKDFFLKYHSLNADVSVDLSNGAVKLFHQENIDWKVNLINTGLDSMTGGRVKRLQNFIGNESFMLTYGDGLSDVDFDALLKFHQSHGKMVTVTGVHPSARFGEMTIEDSRVISFEEKPQVVDGWVNGGFMIIEPSFFEYIDSDKTILEQEPLQAVARMGELMCFPHEGFWQCMDTKRDRDLLQELWSNNNAPWNSL